MKAAIDIGTNTVLLLVGEQKGKKVKVLHEEQRIPRLGKGVDGDGFINKPATNRVIQALKEYKEILKQQFPQVENIVITATSAVRDASNREEFLEQVETETGFEVRLLSGSEEAEWTAAGAFSMLPKEYQSKAMVLDIGGGSTEVAFVNSGNLMDSHSFDMGSVRFTERFLKGNPPEPGGIEACRREVEELYKSRLFKISHNVLAVGVAGTVTTLAAILLNLKDYNPSVVNGFKIGKENISDCIQKFSSLKHHELLTLAPEALKGREDIFLAGLLVLEGFMNCYSFKNITVSTGGIRHGAILLT